MPETTSDLQSKICRAVRALIISSGAGSVDDTIAAPSQEDRPLPVTTITCGDATPFSGPGNWSHSVNIDLRDEALTQSGEINREATRIAASERCTAIINALNQSDDTHTLQYTAAQLTAVGRALAVDETSGAVEEVAQRALDNADMADFTVLWWEFSGVGSASVTDKTFWQRDIQFECVACNNGSL